MNLLKKVNDPEIGINIVDLGLVYDIEKRDNEWLIKINPTTPMCPLMTVIESEIISILKEKSIEGKVEWIFDPPWTPERMNPKVRKRLGI